MSKNPPHDDVPRQTPKVPAKHFTPNGKAPRAESHKGNKVQPAHQRIKRQKGR